MNFDVEVATTPSRSVRAQQLSAAFDVPLKDRQVLRWSGDLPLDEREWNVGLIVGPSGSGKTTVLRHVFGDALDLHWEGDSVVDDFPEGESIEDVVHACGAVGFNTIPAWLRPYRVLSTGEQFRVTLARAFLETPVDTPVVVDEFTSVVDRQVAKIGAHAAAKWARRESRQLIAATCHYDVIEWLQPDWTYEPATQEFTWRHLQPRPVLHCEIRRVPHAHWGRFARFHYLTADLHRGARCFELTVDGTPASFAGVLHRPHPHAQTHKIMGISRLVTLPDWQGLGLAFALTDRIGGLFNALGMEVHMYPAHPSLIRSYDRSPVWALVQRPGLIKNRARRDDMTIRQNVGNWYGHWKPGRRPNAVFRYCGERQPLEVAQALCGTLATVKRTRMSEGVSA